MCISILELFLKKPKVKNVSRFCHKGFAPYPGQNHTIKIQTGIFGKGVKVKEIRKLLLNTYLTYFTLQYHL